MLAQNLSVSTLKFSLWYTSCFFSYVAYQTGHYVYKHAHVYTAFDQTNMCLKNEKHWTPWYFWRIPQLQRILCHMPHHHYIFLCWQYAVVCELILTETDDLKSALTKFDKKILRSQSEAWEKQRVSMSASEKNGADDQQIDFKVRKESFCLWTSAVLVVGAVLSDNHFMWEFQFYWCEYSSSSLGGWVYSKFWCRQGVNSLVQIIGKNDY